mmetsp:Transcript_5350/g.11245  ORF Transcript_5350/g.11245 Transcript_5350/m.11245 type:complete len:210 (-) Transcript_5350:221-850(-)
MARIGTRPTVLRAKGLRQTLKQNMCLLTTTHFSGRATPVSWRNLPPILDLPTSRQAKSWLLLGVGVSSAECSRGLKGLQGSKAKGSRGGRSGSWPWRQKVARLLVAPGTTRPAELTTGPSNWRGSRPSRRLSAPRPSRQWPSTAPRRTCSAGARSLVGSALTRRRWTRAFALRKTTGSWWSPRAAQLWRRCTRSASGTSCFPMTSPKRT